jgi:FAD:protein FMN transferase
MNGGPVFDRFHALGCAAVVGVADGTALPVAMEEVRAEVEACDLACSRFRADSELSSINHPTRKRRTEVVSEWLADALTTAIWAARETDGLVDPTIGQCLIDLGYDRSFELIGPNQPLVVYATHVPAWERVTVRQPSAQAAGPDSGAGNRGHHMPDLEAPRFEAPRFEAGVPVGVRLDLGATAKALCADRAARRAGARAGCGVLVSLGGDVAVAGPSPREGWAVRVTDRADTDPAGAGAGQTVAIRDGGLATSGTAVRRWAQNGHERHHLVDPRTARPAAEVWRTVSVVAASCVQANVASTAAVILGQEAPAWLSGRDVHARLVRADGEVLLVGAWPRDGGQSAPAGPGHRTIEGDRVVAA